MSHQSDPKVSIIIRTFNEAKHLGDLLRLCSRQKVAFPFEVIVVDSGSTDGTREIAKSHDARLITIPSERFTFGRSLNLGIENAKGEFCVIVSGHCLPVDDQWLSKMIEPFSNPRIGMVYGKQRGNGSAKYSEQQIFLKWFPENSIADADSPFCNNANSAIRKSLWSTRRFDEELAGLEDMAWAKEILKAGSRLAYQGDATVFHIHDESYGQIFKRYFREALAYRQIYPYQSFGVLDYLQCFFLNAVSDLLHAIRDGVFWSNFLSVVRFRHQQFWATYRGHNVRQPEVQRLHRRLYFPRNPKSLAQARQILPQKTDERMVFDISRGLSGETPVWPGNRQFTLTVLKSHDHGDGYQESEFSMNLHTGTHVDAPAHFVKSGGTVDGLDLRMMMGRVLVVEYESVEPIDTGFLRTLNLRGVERLLFRTPNSSRAATQFDPDFIALTSAAAEYLVELEIGLVGIDGPSVQLFRDQNNRTHEILLARGVVILEGLDLGRIKPGFYTLIALPLKLNGAEGAPARVVLLNEEASEHL